MDPAHINAVLAELTPAELLAWPRFLSTWEQGGAIEQAEADEWRLRVPSWQAFLDLDSEPLLPA